MNTDLPFVLKAFTSFVTSKQLVSLPSDVLEKLLREVEEWTSESSVTTLDSIFQHFVTQDPRAEHASYPMESGTQNETLASLVKFACVDEKKSDDWKALLRRWIGVIDKTEILPSGEGKLQELQELRRQIDERLTNFPVVSDEQNSPPKEPSNAADISGEAVPATDQAISSSVPEDLHPHDKAHSDVDVTKDVSE